MWIVRANRTFGERLWWKHFDERFPQQSNTQRCPNNNKHSNISFRLYFPLYWTFIQTTSNLSSIIHITLPILIQTSSADRFSNCWVTLKQINETCRHYHHCRIATTSTFTMNVNKQLCAANMHSIIWYKLPSLRQEPWQKLLINWMKWS